MPLSPRVTRFNRRFTNHLTRRIAGWMPGFGVVMHTGRKSGKRYETPINLFRTADGYRIALTYGPETDWVRNVLAAGGCELRVRGNVLRLTAPRLVRDPEVRWAPPFVRFVLRLTNSVESLELTLA